MLGSKVKNLKVMPTSQLVFYSIYNDQSYFQTSEINSIIAKRLTKKYKIDEENSNRLVERDSDIIISRGNDLSDYIFNYNRGLRGTQATFYKKLNKSFFLENKDLLTENIVKNYTRLLGPTPDNFTFSELCLGFIFMSRLEIAYKKRNGLLSQADKAENEKMKAFYEYMTQILLEPLTDILLTDNFQDNAFQFLKESTALVCNVAKEDKLCIANDKTLKAELNNYKDLSYDVVSLDKQVISKSEEASKVYRLATKKSL